MSNQRPAWFRFSSIAVRPPVPAQPPPSSSAPAPTQTPTFAPPPRPSPFATPAAPPPNSPVPTPQPPATSSTPPRSSVGPPPAAAAAATPSKSPVVMPPTPQPSPPVAPPQKVSTPPPPKSPTPSYSPLLPKTTTGTNSQQPSPKTRTQTSSPSSSPKQSTPTHKPVATLTLPPLQIKTDSGGKREPEPEIEQKNILVHEPTHKPTHITPRSYVASKGKKSGPTYKTHNNPRTSNQVSGSEEFGMRVITLAGENRGAIMELKPYSHNRNAKIGSLSSNSHQSGADNGEGKSKNSNKEKNDKTTVQPSMTLFLNSNVQGVNNSILYNTSCHHNDPGIHLSITRKPKVTTVGTWSHI